MYADDIIPYSIGDTIEDAVTLLNQALPEVYNWCLENKLSSIGSSSLLGRCIQYT